MNRVILLLLTTAVYSCSAENDKVERIKRFSIFNVVQFPNTQCTLASSTTTNIMMGVCYTASECSSIGGTVSGNCASGFGVCCALTVSTCGTTVSRNCTYIQNPNFPSSFTTTGACSYTFSANTDICQIRLDFNNFVLNAPTLAGACTTDNFKITSASSSGTLVPPVPGSLCGTNTGQHIYFETGRQINPGNIAITIGPGAPTQIRTWKIKVTFIECSNPNRAPTDCSQYFTGATGNFQSFNYVNGNGQFIQNQNYGVCFRQEEGFCSINYDENDLPTAPPKSFVVDLAFGLSSRMCTIAGLIIPTPAVDPLNAGAGTNNLETFCGEYLNSVHASKISSVVTSETIPFNVGVWSSNSNLGGSFGYNLMYTQVPC